MIKIDELKEPIELYKHYLVPCIKITEPYDDTDLDWERKRKYVLIPIINNLHNDIDSGQNYFHYHIDYRFVGRNVKKDVRKFHQWVKNFEPRVNLEDKNNKVIQYKKMRCLNTEHKHITSNSFINTNKLKHNCIYKGKCSHKGYDLSQELPVNGIITCPLHGLKFDAITKKLIK